MYHPQYSANGVCCKNVVDECIAQGHQVICVVNSYGDCPKEDFVDGAKLYRIKHKWIDRVNQFCEREENAGKKFVKPVKTFAQIVNKIKLGLTSFSWPLVSPLYTYRFYKQAKILYEKEKFSTVVSVYTPIDSLIAGCLLKRKYPEVKFIPYYLDALAGGWGPSKWSYKKKDKRTRKWESFIDKYADVIISMKSSRQYHENNMLEGINAEKRCYLDVPLMKRHNDTNELDMDSKPCSKTLIFAGGISYPRRDPKPILEILSIVCLKTDTEVLFVGECNKPSIFQPYIDKTNGKIKYLGYQPHNKVTEMEQKADCLINIGSTNPYTISGKIFEYMTFLKPIISTFSIEDEPSIKYLEKYKPVLFVDEKDDWQHSANEIIKFLDNGEQSKIDDDTLKKLFYNNTPEAFIDVIDNLM